MAPREAGILVLVVGVYGMNFENMPELKSPWGYYAVLGFIGSVIIIVVMWLFWSRRWIGWDVDGS